MAAEITSVQFFVQAIADGVMTNEEAVSCAAGAVIPSVFLPAFEMMTRNEKSEFEIRLKRMTTVGRSEPLIEIARTLLGWSEQQMDEFFTQAATR